MNIDPLKEGAGNSAVPNGAAAAAILSTGLGCFAVTVCAWLGDTFPAVARVFTFYKPTGPLSGVTTTAIVIWIAIWIILARAWAGRVMRMKLVSITAFVFLGAAFLLSFPPIGDLLQGK